MDAITHPTLAASTCPAARRLAGAAALALLLALAPAAQAFDVQGHRGARGLAPENTLPAFERALAIGVTTLELDVGLSAYDVVVIAHDRALNPAIARHASEAWVKEPTPTIRSLTLAQLQGYDVGRIDPSSPYAKTFPEQQAVDGTRIPTLQVLFARVKALGADELRFNIETKLSPLQPEETAQPEVLVRALLRVIGEAGMGSRVTIQSFDWRTLQIVQRLEPSITTAYLSIQTGNNDNITDARWTAGLKIADHGSVPKMVKAAGGAVWSPNGGALTEALVKEAQSLGLKVIPWTINDPKAMERFIGWGVDGLITDYPDRLRELMQRRGMPVPRSVTIAR